MSGPSYLLGRSLLSATRLNLNHYQWKQVFGYALHPSIPCDRGALQIADIGTGTGIWACDVQREMPRSAKLEGFDISPEQFTCAKHLPKNVTLCTLDGTAGVPDNLRGRFDVVHLRLLQAAISDNDPSPFLAHCKSLLKPGGFLQWDEIDRLARDGDDSSAPNLERLRVMAESMKPSSWIGALPQILDGRGFNVTAVDRRQEEPWQRQQMMESAILVAEEVSVQLDSTDPSGRQGGTVREATRHAAKEARNGAFFSQTFQVVVAQLEKL